MRGEGKNMLGDAPVSSNCSTPKQVSATEQAFNLARQNKNQMFDAINFLEERLKPITKQKMQELPSDTDCAKEELESVTLVASIKDMAKDFGFATKRIKSLIERLEI